MTDLKKLIYIKTNRSTDESYEVDPHMLELLTAIDGKKNVQQVANEVNMTTADFRATFLKIVKMGLIKQVVNKEPSVSITFVENIKEKLIQLIGPVGDMLIDVTAEDMGFETNEIPISSLANYIENLAREIPNPGDQTVFKEQMLREMRNMEV